MKKFFLFVLLFCGIMALGFAEAIAEQAIRGNQRAELSYALGMIFASDIKEAELEINYDAFMRGFKEVLEDKPTEYGLDEAMIKVDTAVRAIMAERAEVNRVQEAEFLRDNATRPGIYTTDSGLQYEILEEGTGRQPEETDYVMVHYIGYLLDGTVFDSSYDWGEPAEFPLQGVIPGWSEGLRLMHEGGKSRLFIPSDLAYGSQGAGNIIPPYSVLIFEVEFLEIIDDMSEYFWYEE